MYDAGLLPSGTGSRRADSDNNDKKAKRKRRLSDSRGRSPDITELRPATQHDLEAGRRMYYLKNYVMMRLPGSDIDELVLVGTSVYVRK